MIKKFMIVLFASTLLISCANSTQNTETSEAEAATELTVDNFESMAGDLIGKPVVLIGTINHVCEHGGQKMFLVEEGSEASIKVVPNESMAAFNTNLKGSKVKVEGIIEALIIDEEYLLTWESELASADKEGEGDGHGVGKGEAADMGEHIAAVESIAKYRKQIAESGTDHLAFYSIVCTNYEMIQAAEKEE
jgi:fructose-specific component phosphotransferase system IIB-like protein